MHGFETSNKSLPSTRRKIPYRDDFDIETINPCVSRSGQVLFDDGPQECLDDTATICIRKTVFGESAGSSAIWGPRRSIMRFSAAQSERAVNSTDDDVRHGSVLLSSSLKNPVQDAQLLEKISFLEAKCESLHLSKKAADANTKQVEDVCLKLRERIVELEHHFATSSNPEIARLQEEVIVQERIVRTYKEDNERLLKQLKNAKPVLAITDSKPCESCEALTAQVDKLKEKIALHASVAEENCRLGEEYLKRGDEIYTLKEEISRLKRANSAKRISGLIQTVETLQGVLKNRNPDSAFEALLSAATANARIVEEFPDNRARLRELDDQWLRRMNALKAQHDKLKVEYDKRQVMPKTLVVQQSDDTRVAELERQLEATRQFYLGKIKRSEPLIVPEPGNFYLTSVTDLRRFLASACGAVTVKVAAAASAAAHAKSVEPLIGLEKFTGPEGSWEAAVSSARAWLEEFLAERNVKEFILEEELKEACEAGDCLVELAMDLEISSVTKWGNAGPALRRCGVESVIDRVKTCSECKINPRRLLEQLSCPQPSPVMTVTTAATPGAYRRELDDLLDGLNALQRQTESRQG